MFTKAVPLALALTLLVACAKKDEQKSDSIKVEGGSAPVRMQPAPAEVHGQDFVSSVLGSLRFERQSAQAAGRTQRPEVKRFADKLGADMAGLEQQLTGIAGAGGLNATATDAPGAKAEFALLSSSSAATVDQALLTQQTQHLSDLLGLIRAYKNGGDNPALKDWAQKAQTVVNDRLMDAQNLSAVLQEAADTSK